MTKDGAGLFDFDSHFYETRDCFTRHIDPEHRDRAVRAVTDEDGTERLLVGDRPFDYVRPRFDAAVPPGAMKQVLRDGAKTSYDDALSAAEMRTEFQRRIERVGMLDRQGVDTAVVFPTLATTVEHAMRDDVVTTYANLRAFNRWVDEEWGFHRDGRIHAPALMSLLDVDRAVEEFEWALERGARVLHLRATPVRGRSIADPVFDPFWARVEEAGAVVAFHITDTGYNEMFSTAWGERANPPAHEQSAFQWVCFHGDRAIMDTMAALVMHNLFGRFPGLRVASVEFGSMWVPYLLERMDRMKGMGRYGDWIGGRVRGRPSDIFREHVYVVPYFEDDVPALVEAIGPERVLFGSDFPHPEGFENPADFGAALEGLDRDSTEMIMRDNARALLGS